MLTLVETPGLPDADVRPPTVAESGDPFAELRVVHLVARLERGVPVRLRDVVDRLNADWVDWSFSRPVVVGALVQLQANWLADFRSAFAFMTRSNAKIPASCSPPLRSLDQRMIGSPRRSAAWSRRIWVSFWIHWKSGAFVS